MKDLPNSMMEALRGRAGLEVNDDRFDEKLLKQEPEDIVRQCVAWELGDPDWANRIGCWMHAVGAKPENF